MVERLLYADAHNDVTIQHLFEQVDSVRTKPFREVELAILKR